MNAAEPDRGHWRLWHFAVVVLVAALILGAIRAIAGEMGDAAGMVRASIVVGTCLVMGSVIVGLMITSTGNRRDRSSRPFAGLRLWGVRRGGVVGFLAWVGGIGLEFAAFLATVLLVAVALPALISLFASLAIR